MNKWKLRKLTRANCGCLAIAVVVSVLGLGFLGIVLLYAMVGPGIESGFGVSEFYHATHGGADRTPQWSADGQTLVVNLGDDIYGASVDGNRLWRIASKDMEHSPSGVFAPSLSVNGEVAYQKYHYDEGIFERAEPHKHHIGLTDINGIETNRLFNETGTSSYPKWSPNGSRLAFGTYKTPIGHQITIMTKRELGQLSPWSRLSSILTFGKNRDTQRKYDTHSILGTRDSYRYEGEKIFWSNDSQQIAFTEQYPSHRIVNIRWDGADKKIVMEGTDSFEPTSLAWSPADDRIYFVYYELMDGEKAGYMPSVRSVRPDGSDERIIVVWTEGFRVKGLKLSPDGNQLLFTTHRSPKDSGIMLSTEELYVMSADGSDARKIFGSTSGSIDNPYRSIYASWSPDGSRIAVHDLGHGGNVFTISPDGADPRVVIGPGVQPGYGKPLPEALGR